MYPQPDINLIMANLPPVSLIPVAICHWCRWHRRPICCRYRWHRWQICHRYQQHYWNWWQNLPPVSLIPVANLPPVSLIPAILSPVSICHRCRWYQWSTFSCEYLREFSKKIWNGLGGNWFMKKTGSKKSRDTVPLSRNNLLLLLFIGAFS